MESKTESTNLISSSISNDFVCDECKNDILNSAIGRCSKCLLPPENLGWCKKCDKFWPATKEMLCPIDGIHLTPYKTSMALRRLANFYIDLFAICAIRWLLINVMPERVVEQNIGIWFFVLIAWGYYFIFESIFQRTIGKFITGTRVVDIIGDKPSVWTIAIRSLIRLIPFEPFSFLGAKVCGWHDRWSYTFVVKNDYAHS